MFIERRHFQWPRTTHTPGFKVTLFLDAEYLNISETVRDMDIVSTEYSTNRDLHTPYSRVSLNLRMTFSDLKWFSKIFHDTKRPVVSLRQLSLFWEAQQYRLTIYTYVLSYVGEEDQNTYDIERLKKPVEVASSTASLPSTIDTMAPRLSSYVTDVTSGFRCTHCGLFINSHCNLHVAMRLCLAETASRIALSPSVRLSVRSDLS